MTFLSPNKRHQCTKWNCMIMMSEVCELVTCFVRILCDVRFRHCRRSEPSAAFCPRCRPWNGISALNGAADTKPDAQQQACHGNSQWNSLIIDSIYWIKWFIVESLTLTLIQPTSKWMHWATLDAILICYQLLLLLLLPPRWFPFLS